MTPTELFADLRRWLGDKVEPYKWETAELVDYYNWALDDLCRETEYFTEANTAAIIHVTLVPGTGDYAFDERILRFTSARVVGQTIDLVASNYRELKELTETWRYINSVTGVNLSFDADTDTITSTSATTTDLSIFKEGDYIEVAGSTSNNETYLISTVTSTVITVDTTFNPIPLTEVAGDQVVIKSINCGTPVKYCLDYRQGYVSLYPTPDAAEVLMIDCIRKQLTPLTSATISSATVPINAQYHILLLDGIMSKAYVKSTPNTFNIEKANAHLSGWTGSKEKVKRDLLKLSAIGRTVKPHNGCL